MSRPKLLDLNWAGGRMTTVRRLLDQLATTRDADQAKRLTDAMARHR